MIFRFLTRASTERKITIFFVRRRLREKKAESEVVRECHFGSMCLTPDGRLFSSRCRLCKCLEGNENRDETEEEPAIERAVIPRIFMRSCHVS